MTTASSSRTFFATARLIDRNWPVICTNKENLLYSIDRWQRIKLFQEKFVIIWFHCRFSAALFLDVNIEHFTTRNFSIFTAKYSGTLHQVTPSAQYVQLDDESIQSFPRKGREKISTERTFVVLMYSRVRVLWRRIMQIAWILPLLHATQVSWKLIAVRICPWCAQRSLPFGLSASSPPRAGPRTSRNFLRSRNAREYEMNYPQPPVNRDFVFSLHEVYTNEQIYQ